MIAGIRAISAFYKDDMAVFNWLKLFLKSDDRNMRREAFKGLLASKHFMRGIGALRDYAIGSEDGLTRRLLLGRLAKVAGPGYVRATTDTEFSNFLDFAEPITRRKLQAMALQALQLQRLRSRELATSHNATEAGTIIRVTDEEVREMARDFKKYLSALGKQYKIPFVFNL